MKRIRNVKRHRLDGPRDQIDLGDSYGFDAYQNASGNVKASLSLGIDESMSYVLVTYTRFNMYMRHDPSIFSLQTSLAPQVSDYSAQTYNANGDIVVITTPPPPPMSSSGIINSRWSMSLAIVISTLSVILFCH